MLETAVKRGGVIHFVNEDLQLTNADDLKTIKKYLEFSKYGKSRLPIGLPLSGLSKSYFDKWSASLANAIAWPDDEAGGCASVRPSPSLFAAHGGRFRR